MCGIFSSVSRREHVRPCEKLQKLLLQRGPDFAGLQERRASSTEHPIEHLSVVIFATVLALRGDQVVQQPVVSGKLHHVPSTSDADSSLSCWNGEAWTVNGSPITQNDTLLVTSLLLENKYQQNTGRCLSHDLPAVMQILRSIKGPFAFLFYDPVNQRIYFGRDFLGRRSLLYKVDDDALCICSVTDGSSGWCEIDANRVFVVDLNDDLSVFGRPTAHCLDVKSNESCAPFRIRDYDLHEPEQSLTLNRALPEIHNLMPEPSSHAVSLMESQLRESIRLRTSTLAPRKCLESTSRPRLAILFSGGLDCSLLARLIHDYLPAEEEVDLLNVAFENPRIHGSSNGRAFLGAPSDESDVIYGTCPDRLTSHSSLVELCHICPSRPWRLVEINVPYAEMIKHRDMIKTLILPHKTEMDFSIASALYFAARGIGRPRTGPPHVSEQTYSTLARVLFSGLGADELFGGYRRHGTAFANRGYSGLINELQLDLSRLGGRNLGRDDRVISHWGREVRYPYLDEDFLQLAVRLPVWEKTGFRETSKNDLGSTCSTSEVSGNLGPEKMVLRLLARKLGLAKAASEKKRAIQFGARTAKMTKSKSRGTDVLD